MKQKRQPKQVGILMLFTIVVFVALLLNTAITGAIAWLMVHLGVISISGDMIPTTGNLILFNAVISVPIGAIVSVLASKVPLKPLRDLVANMDRLASGDFQTRIRLGPLARRYPGFAAVADSFNKMAAQLEGTEMLRSDFVNNFSHEFKTPIVSIAGFAKLLRRGNLSLQQQKEYLAVMEEEALRLSYMATNVLNLTKVENQTILTDVTNFNLSEQIRSCILLLENKWAQKHLEFEVDFGELYIEASEELLKQVWINLLDNAVKFSPPYGAITVHLGEASEHLKVSIRNCGSTIAPEQQGKIWNKFYQGDESHAAEGNGIGLAIVRRITALHGGEASVSCGPDATTFTVTLPRTQK